MTDSWLSQSREWILRRSGLAVLGAFALISLLLQPLSQLEVALPSSLMFAAYVVWLGVAASEAHPDSRSWLQSCLLASSLAVLFGFSLIAHPMRAHDLLGGRGSSSAVVAAIAVVAYVWIWIRIASGLVDRHPSAQNSISVWGVTLILAFMPPFAILWVHHRLRLRRVAREALQIRP